MGLTWKWAKVAVLLGPCRLDGGTETWLGTGKTEKQNFQLDRPSHSNNAGLPVAPPAAAQHVVARCGVEDCIQGCVSS